MEQKSVGNIIKLAFPKKESAPEKKQRIKNVDGVKYFNEKQIKLLRRTVRDQAELDVQKGGVTAIREWLAVDLLTCTGLRVSEAANVRCGDLKLGYAESKIFVRDGKGGISGHVVVPDSLKKHLKNFLSWKEKIGEPTGENDHLFVGQRGAWTSQAIQQIVKKYLKQLGLYENGKSVHALRHSYGGRALFERKGSEGRAEAVASPLDPIYPDLCRCDCGRHPKPSERALELAAVNNKEKKDNGNCKRKQRFGYQRRKEKEHRRQSE